MLSRGATVRIVNNKGQTPLSLGISHLKPETQRLIQQREETDDREWLDFSKSHADGHTYGDLDPRFIDSPAKSVSLNFTMSIEKEPKPCAGDGPARLGSAATIGEWVVNPTTPATRLASREKWQLRAQLEREALQAENGESDLQDQTNTSIFASEEVVKPLWQTFCDELEKCKMVLGCSGDHARTRTGADCSDFEILPWHAALWKLMWHLSDQSTREGKWVLESERRMTKCLRSQPRRCIVSLLRLTRYEFANMCHEKYSNTLESPDCVGNTRKTKRFLRTLKVCTRLLVSGIKSLASQGELKAEENNFGGERRQQSSCLDTSEIFDSCSFNAFLELRQYLGTTFCILYLNLPFSYFVLKLSLCIDGSGCKEPPPKALINQRLKQALQQQDAPTVLSLLEEFDYGDSECLTVKSSDEGMLRLVSKFVEGLITRMETGSLQRYESSLCHRHGVCE